jgi:hypothetical protein
MGGMGGMEGVVGGYMVGGMYELGLEKTSGLYHSYRLSKGEDGEPCNKPFNKPLKPCEKLLAGEAGEAGEAGKESKFVCLLFDLPQDVFRVIVQLL